ncbi:MAG: YaaC family protein [Candidatus Nitrosopolaris sp.]
MLYYSYIKLARVLFLSTYRSLAEGKHGLTLRDNDSITVQRDGAFQKFHDSYSEDPLIYLNTCEFGWKDLMNEKTQWHDLVLNCNAVYLYERNSKKQYLEHELTREIMFTYAMGMLARYKVQYWNELIEGKEDDTIWKINGYLTSTQTIFPNLIYNQLLGCQYYFYPAERELFQLPSSKPQQLPWIL